MAEIQSNGRIVTYSNSMHRDVSNALCMIHNIITLMSISPPESCQPPREFVRGGGRSLIASPAQPTFLGYNFPGGKLLSFPICIKQNILTLWDFPWSWWVLSIPFLPPSQRKPLKLSALWFYASALWKPQGEKIWAEISLADGSHITRFKWSAVEHGCRHSFFLDLLLK